MSSAKQGQGTPILGECDPLETYSLTKGMPDLIVGHLLGFEFTNGGVALTDTIEVPNPEDPDSKVKVIGVFNYYGWTRITADPHYLNFRTSHKNKGIFDAQYNSRKRGPEAQANLKLYVYDSEETTYFPWVDFEGMKKFTFTEGKDVNIATRPCNRVQQPKNYGIDFWITPHTKQTISIAGKKGSPESVEIGTS